MQVAGIRELGGPVELLVVSDPGPLAPGEVLIEVKAAGIGNWDDIVRTGGWDVGIGPPMALGVEAAGVVLDVGPEVRDIQAGDEVMCHPLPLSHQGTWAPLLVAPASTVAPKPKTVSWESAAAFPIPALTAHQVLSETLMLQAGETLLVNGAGGVTGGLLVQLAALRGARVIATAGRASADRVRDLGAAEVFDYRDAEWPAKARQAAGGQGVDAAANAARGSAALALGVVADGGRLATITSDPPAGERGIEVSDVYVRPDGRRLADLAELLGDGRLTVTVGATCGLEDAGAALADVTAGEVTGAAVLTL